ncbi:hypothetical protein Tco_1384017 [Tanacetum coccineum]
MHLHSKRKIPQRNQSVMSVVRHDIGRGSLQYLAEKVAKERKNAASVWIAGGGFSSLFQAQGAATSSLFTDDFSRYGYVTVKAYNEFSESFGDQAEYLSSRSFWIPYLKECIWDYRPYRTLSLNTPRNITWVSGERTGYGVRFDMEGAVEWKRCQAKAFVSLLNLHDD